MHPDKLKIGKQYLLVRYKKHFIVEYLGTQEFRYLKCICDDEYHIPPVATSRVRRFMAYIIIDQLFEMSEYVTSISDL